MAAEFGLTSGSLCHGVLISAQHDLCRADEPIRIALLLSILNGSSKIAGAAALAIERVNTDKALLPGRKLEFSWADSGRTASQGLAAMGEVLSKAGVDADGKSRVNAVIGPGYSEACEVVSYLAGGWNIPQISYGNKPFFELGKGREGKGREGKAAISIFFSFAWSIQTSIFDSRRPTYWMAGCTSPSLSSKLAHPLFSRTVAPGTSMGPAVIQFMKHNDWDEIVILTSTVGVYVEIGLGLSRQLTVSDMKVHRMAAFEPGQVKNSTLHEIRRYKCRVVMLLALHDADQQAVAVHASEEGQQKGWAWLTLEQRTAVQQMQGWCFLPTTPHFRSLFS